MIQCFIKSNVTAFISMQEEEIKKACIDIEEKSIKPIFIYSYSIFESTITEVFRYYLNAFPCKIKKSITIDKEQLIATSLTQDVLENCIEDYIRLYSCKTLAEYLTEFCKQLSIDISLKNFEITKLSNMRNDITHDVTKRYLRLLHTHYRANSCNFSLSKFQEYISTLLSVLEAISNQISQVYASYTYERLVRTVWENTFTSPLLKFDKVWKIQNGILQVSSDYLKDIMGCISSSEHLFLAVFLQQYNKTLNGSLHSFNQIPAFVSLDDSSKHKLADLISFFKYYPYTFNNEILKD